MPEFSFRSATPADLDQLISLNRSAWSQFSEVLTPDNWATIHASITDKNKMSDLLGKAATFVCQTEGKIVGVAYLMPSGNATAIYPGDWSYIRLVGVDPAYRGNKISERLTTLCIDQAKATKEKCVALHTSEIMDAARHVYEKLGFAIVKQLPDMFGVKYWLYKLDVV